MGSQFMSEDSKKRGFPGGSSSSGLKEVEILETEASVKRFATSSKRKEAASAPEIIDLDIEEDYKDIILIDDQVNEKGKGKSAYVPEIIDVDTEEDDKDIVLIDGQVDVKGKGKAAFVPEIIDVDIEEDYKDIVLIDDQVDVKGKGKEISPNIPADFSNLSNIASGSDNIVLDKNIDVNETYSNLLFGDDDWMDAYYDDITLDDQLDEVLQAQLDIMNLPPGIEAPFPWLQTFPQNSTNITSNNLDLKVDSNGPSLALDPSSSGSTSKKNSANAPLPKLDIDWSTYNESENEDIDWSTYNKPENDPVLSSEKKAFVPHFFPAMPNPNHFSWNMINPGLMVPSGFMHASGNGPRLSNFGSDQNVESAAAVHKDLDEIKRKFESFKRFDSVEDFSDHQFVTIKSAKQVTPPKNWVKKIQEEWKILEKDLPDTIFVRVYESGMDLLRAVIVGAEGTPYHDGLFVFDICFPRSYPNSPPKVHYHSGGLRLNPNLYSCGKVCLSLLNTWNGGKEEQWQPGVSTVLQVLVSIQGLILNAKPYFNEPGCARLIGTKVGDALAFHYNEDTFLLSLRNMVYTINRPPKHFEALVAGHFVSRARDILVSCKAYLDGTQVVGHLIQKEDEEKKGCSWSFKKSLARFIVILINAFVNTGANDS